jgi:hypothetical protein
LREIEVFNVSACLKAETFVRDFDEIALGNVNVVERI